MADTPVAIPLNDEVRTAWDSWLQVTRDRCHLHFRLEGDRLDTHLDACLGSARATAQRIRGEMTFEPKRILEVGCSTGFNCLALAIAFPGAIVEGIEPDAEAIRIAQAMAAAARIENVRFQTGYGERLPYGNAEFDLIVCHTVIEHVRNVKDVISEMARVLAPGGIIDLEAPNYVWPYEPHLQIWCIPLLGKKLARAMGRLQGKTQNLSYLDHLQFVTPGSLEAEFRKHRLVWKNRVGAKLEQACGGRGEGIVLYRRAGLLLRALGRLGPGATAALTTLVLRSHVYPSVLYTITKIPLER